MASPQPLKIFIAGIGVVGASTIYHLAKRASRHLPLVITAFETEPTIASKNTKESAGLLLTKHCHPLVNKLAVQTRKDVKDIETFFIDCGSNHSQDDGIVDGHLMAHDYLMAAKEIEKSSPHLRFEVKTSAPLDWEIPLKLYETKVIDTRGVWMRSPYSTMVRSHFFELTTKQMLCPGTPPHQQSKLRLLYPELSVPQIQIAPNFVIKHMSSSVEISICEREPTCYTGPDAPVYDPSTLYGIFKDALPELRKYIPHIDDLELRSYYAGKTTYTPDGLPAFETSHTKPFAFTGCNGTDMSWVGGVGSLLAEQAITNELPEEFAYLSSDRFAYLTKKQIKTHSLARRHNKARSTLNLLGEF